MVAPFDVHVAPVALLPLTQVHSFATQDTTKPATSNVRPTRATAPTATRPRVLRAHRMVQTSAHPANQAFTRVGMNASRAQPIRIRTPTDLRGPAALAIVGTL